MCGIAGIFRFDRAQPAPGDSACIERMAEVQRHRGPDAQGTIQKGSCSLAGMRLRILDLSAAADQPMVSDDGRYYLVYNGEIYNYVELRDELRQAGARFRGGGDTEVVLRAFERWGESCVSRFVGMWAFAIYDTHARRLFLSRDRFGIKPLYYLVGGGTLAFASEIKALVDFMRQDGLPVRARPESVATFVATGLVDGLEETFFEGVHRFPQASNAVCDAQGWRTEQYWSLPAAAETRRETLRGTPEADVVALVRAQLEEAVRVHLRSDVPVGACLSGGLDSSTVVGLASQHVRPVHTFTVFFGETGFDERPFANQVIDAFQAEASSRQGSASELLSTMSNVLWHLDEPGLGPSVYSMWLVMQLASQQVKVVLDGQGGDEVFGGYMPYYTQYLYQLARRPSPVKFAQEALSLPGMVGRQHTYKAARDAVAMALRPPKGDAPVVPGALLLRPELRACVDTRFHEWRLWPRVFDDWLNNILYWELYVTRLPALLRYEDRLSMAFSIESRVPLLDHRVAELAFALPAEWKIRRGWSKWVLRRAMEPVLPREIAWRRDKRGFPMPLVSWLRDGLADDVDDLLFTSGRHALAFLDEAWLRTALRQHAAGQQDASASIWRALGLELWLQRFGL